MAYEFLDTASVNQRLMEQLKVGHRLTLPRWVRSSARFDAVDDAANHMILELQAYVLADKWVGQFQEVSIDVPSSWWQMWKRDHAPAWFIRRYRVRFTTLTTTFSLDRYQTYPDASFTVPEELFGKPVVYERLTRGHVYDEAGRVYRPRATRAELLADSIVNEGNEDAT